MATLKDVAERAGVSITTASVVANGREEELRISPETVEKVRNAIAELDYHSNQNASRLRKKIPPRTTIAFFWPIDYHISMMGDRISNLTRAITEYGLDYKLVIETFEIGHIDKSLHHLTDGRYDGAIIGGINDDDLLALENLAVSIPVVLLNRSSLKYSSIGIDQAQAGVQIATMIFRKGYTSCAVVKASERNKGMDLRLKSFLSTCSQLGVKVERDWMFTAESSFFGGSKAAVEYCTLKDRPSVIFFEYDRMVQGALRVFRDADIRIPKDIEILAFGMHGSEAMDYLVPSISTISVPSNVEKQAVALIAKLREEKPDKPIHVELEPVIQLRESFRL